MGKYIRSEGSPGGRRARGGNRLLTDRGEEHNNIIVIYGRYFMGGTHIECDVKNNGVAHSTDGEDEYVCVCVFVFNTLRG